MNNTPHSSAELIGQIQDQVVTGDLLATAEAFRLSTKADALRDRIVDIPTYSPQVYLGIMALGPLACLLPNALVRPAYNSVLNRWANRLEDRAYRLLPKDAKPVNI